MLPDHEDEGSKSCQTSVTNYQSTRGHVPEGCKLQPQASMKGVKFKKKKELLSAFQEEICYNELCGQWSQPAVQYK